MTIQFLSWPFSSVMCVCLICTSAFGDPPSIQIQLDKADDSAKTLVEAGRTVIVISSESGIGRATLQSKDGDWPRETTLRLNYRRGNPFKTLEGFEMTTSRLQIRTRSGDSGKAAFFLADKDGKFSRDDPNPGGWLNVAFKPHGDDLDVIFPANFLRDEKEVRIQWIDFYR